VIPLGVLVEYDADIIDIFWLFLRAAREDNECEGDDQ